MIAISNKRDAIAVASNEHPAPPGGARDRGRSASAPRFADEGAEKPVQASEEGYARPSSERNTETRGSSRKRESSAFGVGVGGCLDQQSAMAQALRQPSYRIKPRVVIVDDHPTFRHAARTLLAVRGYDVVGEASCAVTALDVVELHAPQAVLLDVRLGDDDGFEVCRLLTRSRPELAVLLVSADEQHAERITRCGASGFVRKSRLLQIDFGEFWPSAD